MSSVYKTYLNPKLPNTLTHHVLLLPGLLAAVNICLKNENLRPVLADGAGIIAIIPFNPGSDGGETGGEGSLDRNAASIWVNWSKLGRMLESSVQHDLIMHASSGGMSSANVGLICYFQSSSSVAAAATSATSAQIGSVHISNKEEVRLYGSYWLP